MIRKQFKLTTVGPLVIGLVLVLSFSVMLAAGAWAGNTMTRQSLIDNGRTMLSVSSRLSFDPLYDLDAATLQKMLNGFLVETHIVYAGVRDTSGQVISEATDGWVTDEQISRDLAAQALARRDMVHREIEGYLVMSGPVSADSEQIGTLEIVFDQSFLKDMVNARRSTMFTVLLVLLVGTILAVATLARHATEPLRALVTVADEIGRGNLDVSIPIRGPEETSILGIALERMRTALRELYQDLEQQIVILETQQQVIHELSTPIIPVLDAPGGAGSVVVMPLVGNIDTVRAKDIMRKLLAGMSQYQASVVILDVTGVPIVDSGVANHLNKTVQAARLKGARVIVVGISEAVAESIVDLGIDWGDIETLADLQTGLRAALHSMGIKLAKM
jgi:anti-anti-sigma regulatory factor/HAMP domain-containing protein